MRGKQFCDEQVRGPFKIWRHTHRFDPIGANHTFYEDHIEYALHGGPWVRRLTARLLTPILARAFARRHAIVRERVASL